MPVGLTLTGRAPAAVPGLPTGLPLVAFGTGAVEILGLAVAPGFVLTGVGVAGVGGHPTGDLPRARKCMLGVSRFAPIVAKASVAMPISLGVDRLKGSPPFGWVLMLVSFEHS